MGKKLKAKTNKKRGFGIYVCTRTSSLFPVNERIVVLATSMENAINTVPRASRIERIDGTLIPIKINADVLSQFRKHANKGEKPS